MNIGLVGCSSAKLRRAAPARELYTSPLFRKSVAYVEQTCDRWYVLSAKHGLVHPDTVLEPYNTRLGGKGKQAAGPIWDWAQRTADQLRVELETIEDPLLVVLAGEQYRTVLRRLNWPSTICPSTIPMFGLGIGEQLAWLNLHTAREAS